MTMKRKRKKRWRCRPDGRPCSPTGCVAMTYRMVSAPSSSTTPWTALTPSTTSSSLQRIAEATPAAAAAAAAVAAAAVAPVAATWWHDNHFVAELAMCPWRASSLLRELAWSCRGCRCWCRRMTSSARATRRGKWCSRRRRWRCVRCQVCRWSLIELLPVHRRPATGPQGPMDGVREAQEQRLEDVAACRRPDRQRSRNRSCSKAARPTESFVGDWVSHGGEPAFVAVVGLARWLRVGKSWLSRNIGKRYRTWHVGKEKHKTRV